MKISEKSEGGYSLSFIPHEQPKPSKHDYCHT